MKIINKHHFSAGVVCHIDDVTNNITWSYKETPLVVETVDNVITAIQYAFRLTGVIFDEYSEDNYQEGMIYVNDTSADEDTFLKIVKKIYAAPLPMDVGLVYTTQCGCNMGNCANITDISVINDIHTYGDMIRQFGCGPIKDVYFYPDSVMLYVKNVNSTSLPTEYQPCHGNKVVPLQYELRSNTKYISAGYCR
jgi:hypothetical protein